MKRNNKILSNRALKVSEQLRQLISKILINNDFYLHKLSTSVITVTDVNISPDLKNAKIYIMSSSNETNKNFVVIEELNKKSGYIKKIISKQLKLRYVPKITFFHDSSFEYSQKIDNILKKIR